MSPDFNQCYIFIKFHQIWSACNYLSGWFGFDETRSPQQFNIGVVSFISKIQSIEEGHKGSQN